MSRVRPPHNQSQSLSADDCFAQFDAAFDTLATELSETDAAAEPTAAPRPAVEAPVPMERRAPSALIHDDHFDALDELLASSAASDVREHTLDQPADIERLDEAFDLLDAQLSQAGGAALVPRVTGDVPSPPGTASPRSLAPRSGESSRLKLLVSRPGVPARLAPAGALIPTAAGAACQRAGGRSPLDHVLALLEGLTSLRDRLALNPADASVTVRACRDALAAALEDARQLSLDLDLPTAGVRATFALATLDGAEDHKLCAEIDELVRHIRHDLRSCAMWPIAQGRVWAFGLCFGSDVQKAFPSVQPDIGEAGVCFGLGRYTASTFHMMRVAERGLQALARAADAKAAAASRGAGMGPLLAIVEARLAQVESWKRGTARTHAVQFFRASVEDARALRDAARLLDVEATRQVDEHESLAVCHRTKTLLTRLSGRIAEGHARTLGKRDFAR